MATGPQTGQDYEKLFNTLVRRYAGASPTALTAVMCPLLIPLKSLNREIKKVEGQQHYRASFEVNITAENEAVVQVGRTGKFIPRAFDSGGAWSEIAKGRIIAIDRSTRTATGEIYLGETSKKALAAAIQNLKDDDLWEVDQFGASAKILSALAEFYLVQHGRQRGYQVVRMPEDMAKHLGAYANFDFVFTKGGKSLRVEAKSLWGTNTAYARLIHSTTTKPKGNSDDWSEDQKKNYYPTSSCKFATQDIFAVNLFLREGSIEKFAFAISKPADESSHGLPRSSEYPDHVHQNPLCTVDGVVWFDNIDDVWNILAEAEEVRPAEQLLGELEQAVGSVEPGGDITSK